SRGWLIEQEESEVELMVSQNAMPSILRSQIVMSNDGRCLRSQFATLKDSENLKKVNQMVCVLEDGYRSNRNAFKVGNK
ncbi:MAG: hypothetical protein Q7U60_03260, partial [Candidatus Methanoperedens sp.]|nr:hypothetical protein [Candidatus Methanoperedens sp.]